MTLITGTFKDSGGIPIASGALRVRLDAPLIDFTTVPDSLHTRQPREFPIVNGSAGTVNLPQSQTQQITYEFTLISNATAYEFYFPDGKAYSGPTFQHTDSKWYTGLSFRAGISLELDRVAKIIPTTIDQFSAIVPDAPNVEYALLQPSRITTDSLPRTVRQVAELLTTDPGFIQQLRGGPRPKGNYSPTIYYAKDDQVVADGSSWIYINPITTVGNAPPVLPATSNTYWQLLAARGANGTGTNGNNTAYDPATWNNQTDAPSRGAIRNIIETLAKLADLANLASIVSPTFTGNPARSTNPLATDNSQQIPTTSWVRNLFAPLVSPIFSGNPSVPTQALTDASTKAASTEFVTNKLNDWQGGTLVIASRAGALALTSGSWVKIIFGSEDHDPKNLFDLANSTFIPAVTDFYEISGGLFYTFTSGFAFSDLSIFTAAGAGTRLNAIGSAGANGLLFFNSQPLQLQAGVAYDLRLRVDAVGAQITGDAICPTRLLIRRCKV